MQFPVITYGMMLYILYKRQYTDKTLTLRKIYEYASERGASLEIFCIFTF